MPKLLKTVTFLAALAVIAPATANAARPVYVSDITKAEVRVFQTDASGALQGSPQVVTGIQGEGLVTTPNGKYLYVVDYTTGVRGFSVGANGAITEIPIPPTLGSSHYELTVTADGKHLYLTTADAGSKLYGYTIGADGSLTAVPGSPYMSATTLGAVAATPDSTTLYAVDRGSYMIRPFTIAADGSLTPKASGPLPTGDEPYFAVVTPDGKHVYVGNYVGNSVSGYSVDASGGLTALPGSPFSVVNGPYAQMAVSPDGSTLYVTAYDDDLVVPVAIAANGALSPGGTSVTAGNETNGVAVTPDGKNVYASAGSSNQLFAFSVQPGGLVANGAPQTLAVGGYSDQQSVAVGGDQPPVATLKTKAGNNAVDFDASASTDPDGTIASFAWDFGDGKTETTTVPTVSHKYAKAGNYDATVTLTDNEGCSTRLIYTGQATLCNGSAVAAAKTAVDAGVDGAKVKAKGTQKQKGSLKIVVKAGAKEKVKLAASGSASFKGVKDKIALKKAKGSAKAGKTRTLKLKAKKKDQGKAVVGFTGKAKITVKLTDDAGNVVSKTVSVKLR